MTNLKAKTVIITGASRGIGKAMSIRLAQAGANIVIAAKSDTKHPKLPGTIYETATEVEKAGGQALPIKVDVRSEKAVSAMMEQSVKAFGRIDGLINNAGAISLTGVEQTPVKRFDLMQNINARAVYLTAHIALPFLKKAPNPHILSLSPPLNLNRQWLKDFSPYTLSKYGMTLLSLGMAEEFAKFGIAVNCLWPQTIIATAAIEFAVGSRDWFTRCRKPSIMADAAYEILVTENCRLTGQCIIDEQLLRKRGVQDFASYAYDPSQSNSLQNDLFLDAEQ